MNIANFRGVYMRNNLPKNRPYKKETAIINLDNKDSIGTHWVCYKKINNQIKYFDSFGNLKPPQELIHYFGSGSNVYYNHERFQQFNTFNCGHLCLNFLYNN